MKKQTALISFFIPLFFCLFANMSCYAAGETWVHKYSVPDRNVRFHDVISVSSGGYLAVGSVWDSDTGDTRQNAIISRFGQNGQVLWSKNFTFSGSWSDDLRSVVQSSDGGFIATGKTHLEGPKGIVGFGLVSAVLILKVDANGSTVWRKIIKNDYEDNKISGHRIKATNDGNYVIVGETMAYRRHENGNNTRVKLAGLIVKIDTNGNALFNRAYYGDWEHSWGWSFNDVVQGVDGSFYVTGVDKTSSLIKGAAWGILVARISKNGALVWVRSLDSAIDGQAAVNVNDSGKRVLLSGGSIYVTGITGFAFNLSRLSLAGAHNWTKQYSCVRPYDWDIRATNDFIHSGDGNFYVLTGNGCNTIAKIDPQGEILRGIATPGHEDPTSLMLHSDKGLIFSSWDSSDNSTTNPGTHSYVKKYDRNGDGCGITDDITYTMSNLEVLNNAVPYAVSVLSLSDDQIPVFNGPALSFEQSCSITPPPVPSRPTGIRATDGAFSDRVRVTFNLVAGATVYRVFRCTSTTGTSCGTPVGFPKTGTFDDRKGAIGVVYLYRVRACNASGCGLYSVANAGSRKVQPALPARPTLIRASDGAFPTRVRITWNSVPGSTVYRVFRCQTKGPDCGHPVGFPNSPVFDDFKGTAGVVYFYRVRACTKTGTKTTCGLFSVANPGHSGSLPSVKADTSNQVQAAYLRSTTAIPVLNGGFGRSLLILMMLGTGLILMKFKYVRSRQ